MGENVDVQEPIKKKLKIFGLDFSNDPCARNSLMYGIGGGMLSGVLYNVFARKSPYGIAIGVLGVAMFGSYIPCKYIQYKNEKFKKQLEPLVSELLKTSCFSIMQNVDSLLAVKLWKNDT
jgi:hypothetical protein